MEKLVLEYIKKNKGIFLRINPNIINKTNNKEESNTEKILNTLKENSEVQYKVDEYYSAECDRSVKWSDAKLNIDWQISVLVLR